MRFLRLVSVLLLSAFAGAQGSISGTLFAPDTMGYVVLACYPSADGCDEALSGYAELAGSGRRQAFSIDGLTEGAYVLIAWLDANGNGEPEDSELSVLLNADGEAALVTPPLQGLEFRITGGAQVAPAATQPQAPAGAAPTELVGIWQETRASSGDYRDLGTGREFTATSGFSAQLRIGADASYYMAYYTSGYETNCALQYSYYEQSTGTLRADGGRLVLQPAQHRVDVAGCTNPGSQDLGTDPLVYDFVIKESFDLNGLRSYDLVLTGGPHELDLELLHHTPLMPGYQPVQPADFVLGDVAVYSEFVATWAAAYGSDLNFYNPSTGAFYLPEYNGSSHEWLRFGEADYELAHAWRSYNYEGICKKDYVYYERGTPTFSITQPAQYQGGNIIGHLRLRALAATVIVNIFDCDELDQVLRYDLVPQTSYYTWNYRPETNDIAHIPDGFTLMCPWPRAEWQFMVCESEYNGYVRR